jgi:CheY-like chemotaxis protein
MTAETVNLLIVEDDDVAVMGMQRAFKKVQFPNPRYVANDGLEALEMLRGENGREALPRPVLVLLDLNMPRMNGFEFLEEIRSDPELRQTIVFVHTTSDKDNDKVRAYKKNVAGYIVKNDAETTFLEALGMLDRYWRIVEFPC